MASPPSIQSALAAPKTVASPLPPVSQTFSVSHAPHEVQESRQLFSPSPHSRTVTEEDAADMDCMSPSDSSSCNRRGSSAHSSPPTSPSSSSHHLPAHPLDKDDALQPIRPAYFYPMDPSNPESHQDEAGIPVFEPTMAQFADFYRFCEAIDSWGMKAGIVKVVPPKEWMDALPSIRAPDVAKQEADEGAPSGSLPNLEAVRIKSAIAQHFSPAFKPGLWRQTNITRPAKVWNVKQWSEACRDLSGPSMEGVKELVEIRKDLETGGSSAAVDSKKDDGNSGIRTRSGRGRSSAKPARSQTAASQSPQKKRKKAEQILEPSTDRSDREDIDAPKIEGDADADPTLPHNASRHEAADCDLPTAGPRAAGSASTKIKAADLTTAEEWADFDPNTAWLQEWATEGSDKTLPRPDDWSPAVCREIEAEYWRGLNFGKAPMYGADLKGTLFTRATRTWNVNSLDNLLTRLKLRRKIAGVTDPYLYFGMWRATFAWHVEDMDLYSINYIHFGAPKQWYAIPQRDRLRFETALASAFPADARRCSQFMRHKSFLASPTFLAANNIRPLKLVQHAREFVITYPYGYHSGFNLGFNCAESVNFALESWLDIGRKAKACECEDAQQSVKMDVDALLEESEELTRAERRKEERERTKLERQELAQNDELRKAAARARRAEKKKLKEQAVSQSGQESVGPSKPPRKKQGRKGLSADQLPCVFCPSSLAEDLVWIPPEDPKSTESEAAPKEAASLRAHRFCANSIPECWVERNPASDQDEVQGYHTIAKARWTLKCSVCSSASAKYGCAVQCTFGSCAKAAHPTCAAHETSGWMMDMLPAIEADKLEARGAYASKSKKAKKQSDPLGSDATTLPKETTAQGTDSIDQVALQAVHSVEADLVDAQERMVVLCRGHNPEAKLADQLRKARHLRECAMRLLPGSRIKVKANGGIWETTLIALKDAHDAASEGEALVDDAKGPRRLIKWSRIIFPPDIVAPASQASGGQRPADERTPNTEAAHGPVQGDPHASDQILFPGMKLWSEDNFAEAQHQWADQTAFDLPCGRLLGGAQRPSQSEEFLAAGEQPLSGKGQGSNETSGRESERQQATSAIYSTGVTAPEGRPTRPEPVVRNSTWSVAPLGAHLSSSRVLIGSSSNSTLITPADTPPLHPYAMTKGPGFGYGTNSFGHHSLAPVRQRVFPALDVQRRPRERRHSNPTLKESAGPSLPSQRRLAALPVPSASLYSQPQPREPSHFWSRDATQSTTARRPSDGPERYLPVRPLSAQLVRPLSAAESEHRTRPMGPPLSSNGLTRSQREEVFERPLVPLFADTMRPRQSPRELYRYSRNSALSFPPMSGRDHHASSPVGRYSSPYASPTTVSPFPPSRLGSSPAPYGGSETTAIGRGPLQLPMIRTREEESDAGVGLARGQPYHPMMSRVSPRDHATSPYYLPSPATRPPSRSPLPSPRLLNEPHVATSSARYRQGRPLDRDFAPGDLDAEHRRWESRTQLRELDRSPWEHDRLEREREQWSDSYRPPLHDSYERRLPPPR
ncbi:unnamed protein product [Parajaminaea phylloscopi]